MVRKKNNKIKLGKSWLPVLIPDKRLNVDSKVRGKIVRNALVRDSKWKDVLDYVEMKSYQKQENMHLVANDINIELKTSLTGDDVSALINEFDVFGKLFGYFFEHWYDQEQTQEEKNIEFDSIMHALTAAAQGAMSEEVTIVEQFTMENGIPVLTGYKRTVKKRKDPVNVEAAKVVTNLKFGKVMVQHKAIDVQAVNITEDTPLSMIVQDMEFQEFKQYDINIDTIGKIVEVKEDE